MRRILLIVLCALTLSTANAACERNEQGVFEEESCASVAATLAKKEMEATYERVRDQVFPHARAALEKSQQAWKAYQEATTDFTLAQEGDGSAGRMVAANDAERAIRARIVELAQWLPRK